MFENLNPWEIKENAKALSDDIDQMIRKLKGAKGPIQGLIAACEEEDHHVFSDPLPNSLDIVKNLTLFCQRVTDDNFLLSHLESKEWKSLNKVFLSIFTSDMRPDVP